jgi:8-oxo-dGTP pyrophosphatase MutT (NUDIX family)
MNQKKKSNPDLHIQAGGGLLYRGSGGQTQVLVIQRNGVWDLPKGKLDDGESIEECALREVSEELGIPEPVRGLFLCDTWHTYRENGMLIEKKTTWFAMTERDETPIKVQQEEGITDFAWVGIPEALDMVHFENLKIVIRTFQNEQAS